MAVLSLPDYHVTGPVHHYLRSPAAPNQIFYLGTAETTPRVELRPAYQDVMNDIAGRSLPAQRTFDGESAMIGTVLTRFSKSAYAWALQAGVMIAPGFEGRFSRGSLVYNTRVPGGLSTARNTARSFELWLVFENYWNPAYQSPNQTPGYYFPQCVFAQHVRDTLGTAAEKMLLAIDAQPYWMPQQSIANVSGTERAWLLYSTAEADFPVDVRVPQ